MVRAPRYRLVAVLITGLLLAAGLQVPAEAAITRTLSMGISAGSGAVRSPIRFFGKLSRSPQGSIVSIQRKSGTRWVTAKSTRTTTTVGNYSVPVALPGTVGTYSFRAVAPATSTRKLAVSRSRGITVLYKVIVTATPTSATVPAGSSVPISGTVKPFVPNSLVSVQKFLSNKWTNVGSAPISTTGKYAAAVVVGPTTKVRIASPLVRSNAVGYSPTITITTTPVIATSTLPAAIRTVPYSVKLTTIDGSVGTWTASPLPGGLLLDPDTGVISGTPTTVGIAATQVQFTKTSTGFVTPIKTIQMTVNEAPKPVITTTVLPTARRTKPYSMTLLAQGNPVGTWSAAPLPDGLTLDAATGVISGTPTTIADTDVVINFQQTSTGLAAIQRTIKLTVLEAPAPVITTASLPNGKRLSAYTTTLTAQGDPVGTWSAGPLPDGLSLDLNTGVISGTPTTVQTNQVVLTFTETSSGVSGTKTLPLQIVQADPPVISTTTLPDAVVGTAYTTTLQNQGNTVGVWTAAPLPAGLALDANTGVISGTPTTSATTSVVIGFTQTSTAVAAAGKTIPLKVLPGISQSSLTPGTAGVAYSLDLQAVGANQAGTWTAAPLPAGLTLNATTGVIAGTPTAAGSTNVVITFKQTTGGLTSPTTTLALVVAPVISTVSLPDGSVGGAYSTTLAAVGGTGTWTASPLPDGLTLNAGTGAITGTPTTAGTTNVDIGFTSGGAAATLKTLALAVKPVITTASLPGGTDGVAYSTTLTAVGGTGTWTASPLPAGLTLNAGTGVVSGTPTDAGTTSVLIGFTSGGVAATTLTLPLAIKPVISTASLPGGSVGAAYTTTLAASGTGTWSASPLPAGLSLNSGTGVISGTPTAAGTTNVVIGFTSNGVAATGASLALVVKPVITTVSLPNAVVGSVYSVTLTAAAGGTGTWTAAPLPGGLTLNAATGVISGMPTAAGSTSVVLGFTSNGVAATGTTLPLAVRPVISTASLPNGTRLTAYSTTLTATGDPAGTWTASPLPAGLTLNASTGVISGTPTTVETKSVLIGFTQTGTGLAADPKTLSLQIVQAAAPVISTATLPSTTVNVAGYSTTLVAQGNPVGTWTAAPLPAGLSLNAGTGAITGTPTASGTAAVVIGFTQTSTGLAAAPKTINLLVNASISTSSLPDGTRTLAYPSTTVHAVGDPAGTWTATNLPTGLSISTAGVITGTPTTVETRTVTLRFTQTANGGAPQVTRDVSLDINQAANPTITTTSLDPGTVGTGYTTANLVATGPGNPAGTWTATPLPAGVNLSNAGVFSGTPTAAGTTQVVVEFTQTSTGLTASKTLPLAVKPVITTASLADATTGSAYSVTLAANGGSGTWTASPLPSGLSLNAGTGAITGTPTVAGTTSVVIGFTSGGVAATGKTLDIDVAPVISTTTFADGTRTQAYSATLAANGGSGTWTASPLPSGLTLNASTGAITGTPTTVGSTNVVIGFTSGGVAAVGKTLALDINEAPAPVISNTSLPSATRLSAYSADLNATGNPAGTWSVAPALPTGLTLNLSTGAITGTPSSNGDLGDNVLTFTFTQTSTGLSTNKNLTLHIDQAPAPVISTNSLADGSVGTPYSQTVHATGNPTGTWSAAGLPPGLAIDPDTGEISGTPTVADAYVVTINFTQTSTGVAATPKDLDLTINP